MRFRYQKQMISILFTILLILPMLTVIHVHAENNSKAIVNVETLNVRKGPGLQYSVISKINHGESYLILQTQKDWIEIQLEKGLSGWVAKGLVKQASAAKVTLVRSKVETLNIRSGPSTTFPTIQQMSKKDAYPLVERDGDWIQIELSKDLKGWVAEWLTETTRTEPQVKTPSISQVQINANVLNVRTEPTTDSKRIGQLQKGDIVTVHQIKEQWYKIDHNGQFGWVAGWLVQNVDPSKGGTSNGSSQADAPQVKIINPGTNLRSGPGTNHSVVARGNEGDTFPILSTEGQWYKVALPGGKSAYVAGWIVATHGMTPIVDPKLNSFLSGKTIVIDPGHGGKDVGGTGSNFNTLEKELNMKISQLLKNKLESAGAKVIMIRETDVKIQLETRVYISHRNKADAFISIHHNTNANSRINGIITYYYEGTRDRKLANIVQREVVKHTRLRDLKARKGDYYVLRENAQLSILAELGFLSNYQDEARIRTAKFQEQAAEGIFQGILLYFKEVKEDEKEEN
jgi:N-acetylmuramoyl-L-alanine amidase